VLVAIATISPPGAAGQRVAAGGGAEQIATYAAFAFDPQEEASPSTYGVFGLCQTLPAPHAVAEM
jgi:hypothetical protein